MNAATRPATIQVRRGILSYPKDAVQHPAPDTPPRFPLVVHVKDGKALTPLGAKLLGVRWK